MHHYTPGWLTSGVRKLGDSVGKLFGESEKDKYLDSERKILHPNYKSTPIAAGELDNTVPWAHDSQKENIEPVADFNLYVDETTAEIDSGVNVIESDHANSGSMPNEINEKSGVKDRMNLTDSLNKQNNE